MAQRAAPSRRKRQVVWPSDHLCGGCFTHCDSFMIQTGNPDGLFLCFTCALRGKLLRRPGAPVLSFPIRFAPKYFCTTTGSRKTASAFAAAIAAGGIDPKKALALERKKPEPGALFFQPAFPRPTNVPKGQANVPKGQANVPKGEANRPKGQANVPKGEANVPKGQANRPKGQPNVPKGEANRPKGQANGPKRKGEGDGKEGDKINDDLKRSMCLDAKCDGCQLYPIVGPGFSRLNGDAANKNFCTRCFLSELSLAKQAALSGLAFAVHFPWLPHSNAPLQPSIAHPQAQDATADAKDVGADAKDVGADAKDVGADAKDVGAGADAKDVGADAKDGGANVMGGVVLSSPADGTALRHMLKVLRLANLIFETLWNEKSVPMSSLLKEHRWLTSCLDLALASFDLGNSLQWLEHGIAILSRLDDCGYFQQSALRCISHLWKEPRPPTRQIPILHPYSWKDARLPPSVALFPQFDRTHPLWNLSEEQKDGLYKSGLYPDVILAGVWPHGVSGDFDFLDPRMVSNPTKQEERCENETLKKEQYHQQNERRQLSEEKSCTCEPPKCWPQSLALWDFSPEKSIDSKIFLPRNWIPQIVHILGQLWPMIRSALDNLNLLPQQKALAVSALGPLKILTVVLEPEDTLKIPFFGASGVFFPQVPSDRPLALQFQHRHLAITQTLQNLHPTNNSKVINSHPTDQKKHGKEHGKENGKENGEKTGNENGVGGNYGWCGLYGSSVHSSADGSVQVMLAHDRGKSVARQLEPFPYGMYTMDGSTIVDAVDATEEIFNHESSVLQNPIFRFVCQWIQTIVRSRFLGLLDPQAIRDILSDVARQPTKDERLKVILALSAALLPKSTPPTPQPPSPHPPTTTPTTAQLPSPHPPPPTPPTAQPPSPHPPSHTETGVETASERLKSRSRQPDTSGEKETAQEGFGLDIVITPPSPPAVGGNPTTKTTTLDAAVETNTLDAAMAATHAQTLDAAVETKTLDAAMAATHAQTLDAATHAQTLEAKTLDSETTHVDPATELKRVDVATELKQVDADSKASGAKFGGLAGDVGDEDASLLQSMARLISEAGGKSGDDLDALIGRIIQGEGFGGKSDPDFISSGEGFFFSGVQQLGPDEVTKPGPQTPLLVSPFTPLPAKEKTQQTAEQPSAQTQEHRQDQSGEHRQDQSGERRPVSQSASVDGRTAEDDEYDLRMRAMARAVDAMVPDKVAINPRATATVRRVAREGRCLQLILCAIFFLVTCALGFLMARERDQDGDPTPIFESHQHDSVSIQHLDHA